MATKKKTIHKRRPEATEPHFIHFVGMANRPDMLRIRKRWGWAGYGAYLMLLEWLTLHKNRCILDYVSLCGVLNTTDVELLRSVICDYGLFNICLGEKNTLYFESKEIAIQSNYFKSLTF